MNPTDDEASPQLVHPVDYDRLRLLAVPFGSGAHNHSGQVKRLFHHIFFLPFNLQLSLIHDVLYDRPNYDPFPYDELFHE